MADKTPNLRDKVMSGLFWKLMERLGAQVVTFCVSIVLARLLSPDEYGTVALVTVFINIANVFVSDSLGSALIQKKNVDNLDFSSVFYINILFALVLYLAIFFLANPLASFFGRPELIWIVRILALKLPLASINSVQQAYVAREMIFRKFFFATLIGTVFSAFVGIWMAIKEFGVWALVGQYLVNSFVGTVILGLTIRWVPERHISFERLRGLIRYGWKLMVSALATTLFSEMRNLIIGKKYTSDDLAFYNKGQQIPSMLITNVNTSIDSVLFSAISKCQDSLETVKRMTRRALKVSTFIIFPIMTGLALISRPLMILLLTEKWADCVIYMQIACLTFGFMPIHTANLQAMKAIGRSDLYLKLDIVKKSVSLVVLAVAMWFGPLAIAISGVITTIISCVINVFPNKRLIDYLMKEQIADILPAILLSTVMGVCVFLVGKCFANLWIQFTAQMVTGMVVYVAFSMFFKVDSMGYIIDIVKEMRAKRKSAKQPRE